MKSIGRAINKFCQKYPKFGIPRLIMFVVIVTAIVFLLPLQGLRAFISFHPALILQGEIWRIFTWVFIPLNFGGDFLSILFTALTLYFYYFIGSTLEREWGTGKFTIFYILGILLNIIYASVAWFGFGQAAPLNPMYLNLSMFFSFATLYPDFTIRMLLFIPIKIKWVAILSAAFFLFDIISGIIAGRPVLALLPVVAIFNYFVICGGDLIEVLRPLRTHVKAQTRPEVINFKKAAKQAKQDVANMPYRHKCAVCGKTDTDYPDLEFRYCSQCEGYHCFCMEHINNHIHFR